MPESPIRGLQIIVTDAGVIAADGHHVSGVPSGDFVQSLSAQSGSGIPDGGTTGQALVKASNADGDADWETISGGGDPVPDADGSTKGLVQLAGDLSGTAASPQIAAGAIVNADVSASAAIAESKLALASDAAAGTASRRTLGTGATQAAAGNDSRLSDTRTPTDGSVTAAKIAAALKPSGSAVAATEALRALGTTSSTAAAGDDARLTNARTPSDASVTLAKVASSLLAMLPGVVAWDGTGAQPARPVGFPVVFWVCPVDPAANVQDNDVWITTAAP